MQRARQIASTPSKGISKIVQTDCVVKRAYRQCSQAVPKLQGLPPPKHWQRQQTQLCQQHFTRGGQQQITNSSEVVIIQALQSQASTISSSDTRTMHSPHLTPILQDRHQNSLQQMQLQIDIVAALRQRMSLLQQQLNSIPRTTSLGLNWVYQMLKCT